jgi:tRNA G18 (ribose-2'-O)-methylase SpoU
MTTDVNELVNANDNRQVRECYEHLLAGIHPSVKLNAQAQAAIESMVLSTPLLAHFKVAANTIAEQQKRIECLEREMRKAITECRNNERGAAVATLQIALDGRFDGRT